MTLRALPDAAHCHLASDRQRIKHDARGLHATISRASPSKRTLPALAGRGEGKEAPIIGGAVVHGLLSPRKSYGVEKHRG